MAVNVGLDPPGRIWAERLLVRLSAHPHYNVRANAILGFGHLARAFRYLNRSTVQSIIEAGLSDPNPFVRAQAGNAADDVEWYLGWVLQGRDERHGQRICPR